MSSLLPLHHHGGVAAAVIQSFLPFNSHQPSFLPSKSHHHCHHAVVVTIAVASPCHCCRVLPQLPCHHSIQHIIVSAFFHAAAMPSPHHGLVVVIVSIISSKPPLRCCFALSPQSSTPMRHRGRRFVIVAAVAVTTTLSSLSPLSPPLLCRCRCVGVASLLWRHCCGVIAVASLLLHRRYRFCCRHCVGAIVSLSSLLRCCGRCVFPIADDICHFCCGRCCLLNPNRNRSNRSNRSNRQTQRMNLFADHHHHVKQQHPCLGSRTTNWSVQSIDRSIDRSRLIDRLID